MLKVAKTRSEGGKLVVTMEGTYEELLSSAAKEAACNAGKLSLGGSECGISNISGPYAVKENGEEFNQGSYVQDVTEALKNNKPVRYWNDYVIQSARLF